MMYFVTYYLGSASYFMWMLGAHILGKAAGSALAKRLTQNVSKVQMFGYCSVLAGVLSIALFFAPKSVLILVPMTFIVSTLYQATTTLMWVMMADVADYGEWKQGKRMDGVIFSTFLAVLKLGMAISGAIVGWTLGLSGYVANARSRPTRPCTASSPSSPSCLASCHSARLPRCAGISSTTAQCNPSISPNTLFRRTRYP